MPSSTAVSSGLELQRGWDEVGGGAGSGGVGHGGELRRRAGRKGNENVPSLNCVQ